MTGYKSKRAAAQDKLDSREREALKLALEALEGFIPYLPLKDEAQCNRYDLATTAIKAALAQPAQEPVAMLERDPSIGRLRVTYEDAVTELDEGVYPLYTEPQGWRDNVAQAYLKGFDEGCKSNAKNASKPVAWLEPEWGEKICPEVGYEVTMTDDHPRDLCWIPLYAHPPQGIRNGDTTRRWSGKTENIGCLGMPVNVPVTPPQRTWVGLTKEDMPDGENPMFDHEYFIAGMVFAANILKEKNNG